MTDLSVAPPKSDRPAWRSVLLVVGCVLVMSIGLTWTFFAMRAVMNVGGSCADGGPYVTAQSCPSGGGLLAIGIPMMVIAALAGSAPSMGTLQSPNLLVPMWAFLFGSLGWNFLDYGVLHDGIVWSWLLCGVMFELFAVPAVLLMLVTLKNAVLPPADAQGSRWWVPAYSLLGAVGFVVGWQSFVSLR